MAPSRILPFVVTAVILVVGGLSTFQSAVLGQDYEAVKQRLLKAVEQDGLTFEQAAAMMRALKQVGNDRVDRRRAPNSDGSIRLDGMVLRVKQAIEDGRITEEEGKARLEEAKRRLQQDKDDRSRDRDRDAGNRGQRDRDNARGRDSDFNKDDRPRERRRDAGNRIPPVRDGARNRDSDFNKDDRPRDRRRGDLDNSQQQRENARRRVAEAQKQIKELIKDGQLSKEDGQARMERLRDRAQRMQRDDRGESDRPQVDRRREMDRRDSDRREMDRRRESDRNRDSDRDRGAQDRRPGNAEKEILRMVEDGKLTKEEGRARIKGLREREFRNPQGRQQQQNTGARQRIAEAEKKLKELVESGKISEEEAKARLKELRQRLERMQGDDARRGARDRVPQRSGESDRAPRRGQPDRPQRGPSDRAQRGQSDRTQRGQSDRAPQRGDKGSFNPRSRGEHMGRRLNESERPFETYRKVQTELMKMVEEGDISRADANKKLESLKKKLWSEDSDSKTEGRRERSRGSDRRRGDGESDSLTNSEIETIQRVVEAAVRDGVRKGTESDR